MKMFGELVCNNGQISEDLLDQINDCLQTLFSYYDYELANECFNLVLVNENFCKLFTILDKQLGSCLFFWDYWTSRSLGSIFCC